jgi:hypothetical protein
MLRYNEILKLLYLTKEITLRINTLLCDSTNDSSDELSGLYADRKNLLEELQIFFQNGEINKFTTGEREIINDLVQEIIKSDNQNIALIEIKVKDIQGSMKFLNKQKSLLIYSKSE